MGTAVLTGHGVALADDGAAGSGAKAGSSSSSTSGSSTAAGAGASGDKASSGSGREGRGKPSKAGSGTSPTSSSPSTDEDSARDDSTTGTAPRNKNKTAKPQPKPKSVAAQQSVSSGVAAGSAPAAAGSVPVAPSTAKAVSQSAPASAASVAPAAVVAQTVNVSTSAAPASATVAVVPTATVASPAKFLSSAVSGITSAVSKLLAPFAGNSPTTPAKPGSLEGFLSLVRRELDSLFNNKAPKISYDSSQTLQMNGAILGQINASDPNGDTLKLKVTKGPTNGTVTLYSDGSFKYVPSPGTLVSGGTDSFTVTASDLRGDPLHLNWLSPAPHTATKVITVSAVAQTGPLATATEISTEQRALSIVNSGAMDATMAALKQKWINTQAVTFSDVPGGVDAQNMAQLDAAVREYAMYAAMAAVNIGDNAAGNPSFNWIATPPHTIGGVTSPGNQVFYDNPDTLYRMAFISAGKSYVITGKVNGQMPADVNITAQIGATGQASAILTGQDLQLNPDGTFTIIAGRDASLAGTPNYLYLSPDAGQIFVRNTITDWNTGQGLSLSIQQTDGTNSTLPEAAIENIANGVMMQAVNATTDAWFPLAGQHPVNTLPAPANAGSQTLSTQKQSIGHFNLADNQALVVTLTPGSAKYFNVPVTNAWTVSPDYSTGDPTSLNNAQAIANPDGSYTLVISKTDPGVANWVSTGGLNQGTIFARWQGLDPNSTDQPTLTTQLVTLDQLKAVLPKTTVYYTPQQRAQEIAERQSGYTLRTAPYVSIGNTTAV
ncbi:hypothetical protein BOO86_05465 [Mycobacterium sp. CBMA 234]|nr:hypothetical protein [Mycolicibacterium sp. CBMA 234]